MATPDAFKVVTLITGASSGIGAGTAVLFAKLGARLALNGRDVDSLTKVDKECEACGPVKGATNLLKFPKGAATKERLGNTVLAYCMSKSAIDQFTRCVALELASQQVRVNAVCPGVIITEVHKRAGLDEDQYAQFLEKCKVTHALGRPGEVEEVAHAIAFLASDAATFITGVNLPVDGGRHAMCPR
uniref:Zgc:101858 n=1 Tax=Sinocyclocheilus rhinocerous TaxID=307959 RepID=A0A673MFT0_9TELE